MTSQNPHSTFGRRAITVGLICAAVIVAAAMGIGSLNPPERVTPKAGAGASRSAAPTPAETSITGPAIPNSGDFVRADPAPAGPRTSTEVQQGGAASPIRLPPSARIASLFSGALPKSASHSGGLVAGFPASVSLAQNSTVITSSISSNGTKVQATVYATTSAPSSTVLDFYASLFAKGSLAGLKIPAAAGSTAIAYSGGPNSLTLTVSTIPSGSAYSLFGVFETAG
ncbi:MAG: hypothetical protein H7279_03810 [Microbacteriaceae bacterium]|nr:hypothetical protein [Microbacteriaceae bacterium]